MTDYIIAIPARLNSTRLPNKALLDIEGIPMINRVCMQALKTNKRTIACIDSDKVKESLKNVPSVEVCMTDSSLKSGTDRIAQMCHRLNIDDNTIIVNVQGDEPLINIEHINQVANLLVQKNADMATLCFKIDNQEDCLDPNCVKVVFNKNNLAMYFSRSCIPFDRKSYIEHTPLQGEYYHHVGIYAYRAKMVKEFAQMEQTKCELTESLEQLRLLENGYTIAVGVCQNPPQIGVDTLEDYKKVCQIFKSKKCN